MQPSRLTTPLYITKGGTFRQQFFLQQPVVESRDITGGQAQPLQITVVAHGLPDAWPVWIEGTGIPALERPYPRQTLTPEVVDANTLGFPGVVVGAGAQPRQGQIRFHKPVELNGATVRLDVEVPEGATAPGFVVTTDTAGVIFISLPAGDTEAIDWDRANFKVWLTMSNGDVDCWICGEFVAGGCC